MSVETDFRTFLLSDATIAGIVGTRIYPLAIPQGGNIPAIVYQRTMTKSVHTHDGPTGLEEPEFQLSCWANSPTAAWALAEAVQDHVDGYRGAMGATAAQGIKVVNRLDDSEQADNITRFRVVMFVPVPVAV